MSKHWSPGNVVRRRFRRTAADRRSWRGLRQPDDRVGAGTLATILAAAVAAGLAVGLGPGLNRSESGGWSDAPIEWDSVQAPPTRELSADELEWQRRGAEADASRPATSKPRDSGRAGSVRLSFGWCPAGGGANCVVDGDTFYIGGAKVRIAGIDAPETHPPRCAREAELGGQATARLHALLNSGAVTMTRIERDRDRYGRLLRNVQVDGADVGQALIASGVARQYERGRRGWC